MKLTFWQQFSSNHSASFTVVGVFDSPEKAEAAAQVLRDYIKAVHQDYIKEFPTFDDYIDWVLKEDVSGLTAAEQRFKRQYKLGEFNTMDWVWAETPPIDAVQVYQHLVMVSSQGDTWAGESPFDQFVEKLGGKAYVNQEMARERYALTVTCLAPDEDTTKQLETDLVEVKTTTYDPDHKMYYVLVPDTTTRFEGNVEREDAKLAFKNLEPYVSKRSEFDTITRLRALIAYLESKGCRDFQYTMEAKH